MMGDLLIDLFNLVYLTIVLVIVGCVTVVTVVVEPYCGGIENITLLLLVNLLYGLFR